MSFPRLSADCEVTRRGDTREYRQKAYQYATTSEDVNGSMEPAIIVTPRSKNIATNDKDIQDTIAYARAQGIAIAVRSGGHQYSGASSTGGDNIQLDLTEAYEEFEVNPFLFRPFAVSLCACAFGMGMLLSFFTCLCFQNQQPQGNLVKVGVSLGLATVNGNLGALGLFVPHGQCSHVHVGGHAQTGG